MGAGLAGLSTAYSLARDGIETLVVERGDYPGAKNVSGGRIYLNPIRQSLPDIWDEAPLERHIAREIITLMGESSSTSIDLYSQRFNRKPYHSFSILRSKFDRWFSDKVEEAGAIVATRSKVDDLILEDGKVVGIVAGGDAIHANVIVAADGVMSVMAEKAGLKDGHPPENFAVGVKELIELPSHVIEERFNLEENEGAAQLFIGPLAQDIFGHGFLYTNLESISLGVVVGIKDLMTRQSPIELPQLIEDFRQHPEVLRLIKGGDIVEYSAHVIPEAGMGGIPHLYGDGIIVVGDAAGFALNMGITMRGMEFAIASGAMAAQAIKGAVGKGDFSKESLSIYEDLLKDSFVLKDLNTFKNAPRFLSNPALFNLYPQSICHLFEELMFIGEGPKQKVIDAKWSSLLKDLIGALKI